MPNAEALLPSTKKNDCKKRKKSLKSRSVRLNAKGKCYNKKRRLHTIRRSLIRKTYLRKPKMLLWSLKLI